MSQHQHKEVWHQMKRLLVTPLAAAAITMAFTLVAQADETEDLAKATQNPVADLISLPFQNNVNFGLGPHNRMQYVLNVQPVVPFHLTEDWNLITRTIAPIIRQPNVRSDTGDTWGLGDIDVTGFLSPAKAGKAIWGLGPVFLLPSATDSALGSEKWGAGPSAVVLAMPGHWVVGTLVKNVWSFAGDDDRAKVNRFLLQYFVNYNFPGGWYVTASPIITADWEAESNNRWLVPIGGGAGKIFRVGKLPLNAQLQAFTNVERPDFGPEWTLRFQLQFLFPKG